MSWAIQTRADDRNGEHRVVVHARWLALGSIDGVTMYGGPGVRMRGTTAPMRREMNAFSRPIEGAFDFELALESPEAILEWSDVGELCHETIALTARHHRVGEARAGSVAPSNARRGLRMLLRRQR